MNRSYLFSAVLTVEQCQGYYQGKIRYVQVTAESGEQIRLAFRHLQPFISLLGIRGRFRLTITSDGEFYALEKIN